ncbi:hypothetical protein HX882_24550 [Pseudomonas gingeri]|uniref:Uncharacterized protein n=1 Tax=Pseudomonas gingeri TaxID=117681 RepID=A0A7Y7XG94_9PSED|nr:hypothetical protein [Pseudomonas gingeri]NWB99069.1 hypothetical protein [Pseudomonas gingeri]
MLDRTNADVGYVEMTASAWHELSDVEFCLVGAFRQLNQRDQDQLRRLTEALIRSPEQSDDD